MTRHQKCDKVRACVHAQVLCILRVFMFMSLYLLLMWFVSCLSSVLVSLFMLQLYSFRSQFSVVGGILFTNLDRSSAVEPDPCVMWLQSVDGDDLLDIATRCTTMTTLASSGRKCKSTEVSSSAGRANNAQDPRAQVRKLSNVGMASPNKNSCDNFTFFATSFGLGLFLL